jgi:D-xylose 1-dehydrogenase (NADP+, D-xylono-1,5-lactone-forming)
MAGNMQQSKMIRPLFPMKAVVNRVLKHRFIITHCIRFVQKSESKISLFSPFQAKKSTDCRTLSSLEIQQRPTCSIARKTEILIANFIFDRHNVDMSTQPKRIRWGVLGYARIARESVIPAIQRSANSEFCALASREESKLAECRARFPGVKTFHGYDDLLRDLALDAIYIPLPNSLHRVWTLKAAAQGKHVLCEKPIALNAAECREMITACAAHRVTLMEAFMYRYTARTRCVLDVLRSGALGEIKFISSTFRFLLANPASIKFKPELGGGSLYDVGCYPVNFIGLVADTVNPGPAALPESVSVQCVREHGIDTIFSALLKYPSGLVAGVNCGFNAHRRVFSEIIGTLGTLEIPDTFFDNPGHLTLTIGDQRREIPVPQSDRYRLEVEDFADAILQNRPPQFSLTETLRNSLVLDQLLAASQ